MPNVTSFRKFLDENPPYGVDDWTGKALNLIIEGDASVRSKWLNGTKFRFSSASRRTFNTGLKNCIAKLDNKIESIKTSSDPDEGQLRTLIAERDGWRAWKEKWDNFLASGFQVHSPQGPHSEAHLSHDWLPAENALNASICCAFLTRQSVRTLELLAKGKPTPVLEPIARRLQAITALLETVVVAFDHHLDADSKTRNGSRLRTTLRATCHLVGPRFSEDPPRTYRLCRIAEFCPPIARGYRTPSERESAAGILIDNSDRLLVRAIREGDFLDHESIAAYESLRKWRPIHVFAAPILDPASTGPLGSSLGAVTLDVFCNMASWDETTIHGARVVVSKMQISEDSVREKIRTVLLRIADVCGNLTQDPLVLRKIDEFAAKAQNTAG